MSKKIIIPLEFIFVQGLNCNDDQELIVDYAR